MLADHYTGLTLLTIAAAHNDDLSFSSDTGMAECLVVARKLAGGQAAGPAAGSGALRTVLMGLRR